MASGMVASGTPNPGCYDTAMWQGPRPGNQELPILCPRITSGLHRRRRPLPRHAPPRDGQGTPEQMDRQRQIRSRSSFPGRGGQRPGSRRKLPCVALGAIDCGRCPMPDDQDRRYVGNPLDEDMGVDILHIDYIW
jgi:hypothetical protein